MQESPLRSGGAQSQCRFRCLRNSDFLQRLDLNRVSLEHTGDLELDMILFGLIFQNIESEVTSTLVELIEIEAPVTLVNVDAVP